MISDPKGIMKTQFKCPKCGGGRFGTSYATSPDAIGHCHTGNCDYKWKRADDDKLGVFVPRETPVKILMTLITGISNDEASKYGILEDESASFRCKKQSCNERIWLMGSFHQYDHNLIECPRCKRIQTHPYLRREDMGEKP